MTGKATAAPIRIGVLGAARIADLAIAAHLRDGAPLPTRADDAVASMQLIDDCYRAAGLTPRPAGQPPVTQTAQRPGPAAAAATFTTRRRSIHDHCS
jgi:hypothetical protein